VPTNRSHPIVPPSHEYESVISHISISHFIHVNDSFHRSNEPRHWTSHVKRLSGPKNEWVISNMWMNRIMYANDTNDHVIYIWRMYTNDHVIYISCIRMIMSYISEECHIYHVYEWSCHIYHVIYIMYTNDHVIHIMSCISCIRMIISYISEENGRRRSYVSHLLRHTRERALKS